MLYSVLLLSEVGSYLLGFLYVLLYSLALALVLVPLYYIGDKLFENMKRVHDHWILDAFLSSFIISFVVVLFLYLFPFFFLGWSFESFEILETFWEQFVHLLKILISMLYVTGIIALISLPFAMFFSYLFEKYNVGQNLVKLYGVMYVISVVLLLINMFLPWILGGILLMIYF